MPELIKRRKFLAGALGFTCSPDAKEHPRKAFVRLLQGYNERLESLTALTAGLLWHRGVAYASARLRVWRDSIRR
jgi:hypothetical protein